GVVVQQASLGPYDYAVLHADDETAMLQWLDDNHYFVPAGTMDAVQPYIHPGAYFLALKLRGGESAGDITPVVLRYASDLPMIPITLTQVGAIDNMGVLVWVAGEARAVPHNYYHVVVDDLPVWFTLSSPSGYNNALIDAVHEAPGKHGFITQYAGSSRLVRNRLVYPGRFGNLDTLRAQSTPSDYLRYLRGNGFTFDGTLISILSRYIPEPAELVAQGVPLNVFYQSYDSYAGYTDGNDDGGVPIDMPFDPSALTDEIDLRVVQPTLAADAIFSAHPYLTRMYTALSPKDMTIDPVFSTNADLGDVPLLHTATSTTATPPTTATTRAAAAAPSGGGACSRTSPCCSPRAPCCSSLARSAAVAAADSTLLALEYGMRRTWRSVAVGALACCLVGGAGATAFAQADLPNANLPGNSPTLPNSNLPGPVTTDQPIMLPNTDSSGSNVTEARLREQANAEAQAREQRDLEIRDETMRLAAKAAEESARARAEAAEARQALTNAVEQRQP